MKSLLWVDDEEEIRLVLDKHLRIAGIGYALAGNATEGLMAYDTARQSGHPFALLVLDIAMPDHSGLWMARHIRDGGDKVPIMFCTAYDIAINRIEAEDVDACGWIRKPFNMPDVLRAIRDVMGE